MLAAVISDITDAVIFITPHEAANTQASTAELLYPVITLISYIKIVATVHANSTRKTKLIVPIT